MSSGPAETKLPKTPPQPSSAFPTAFPAQQIKAMARKPPGALALSRTHTQSSAPRKPSLTSLPAPPPCLLAALTWDLCYRGAPCQCLSGHSVSADHLGHLRVGWAKGHCQGHLPGTGSHPAGTLSQRPGSKIGFLEDLEGTPSYGTLGKGASILWLSVERGWPTYLPETSSFRELFSLLPKAYAGNLLPALYGFSM